MGDDDHPEWGRPVRVHGPIVHRLTGIAVVLLAGVVFTAALAAWAIYERSQQTHRNRAANAQVWHDVLCSIEKSVRQDPSRTPAERRKLIQFYEGLLIDVVHTSGCGLRIR